MVITSLGLSLHIGNHYSQIAMDRFSVGVDVLYIIGGVFFWFYRTVWVRFLVLDDYLVIDGVVCVRVFFFCFAFYFYAGFLSEYEDMNDYV